MKGVLAMLHGGMDTEIANLVMEHESERFQSNSRGQLSLGHTDSSSEVSSLMSKVYPNSSLEMSFSMSKEPGGSSLQP